MNKIDKYGLNIEKLNIEKIKKIFPSVITDGKINFEILKTLLGEEVDSSNEKYQFTWNGKGNTIKFTQTPSTGTLRPSKKDSINFDYTENMYIEGDNVEVLKILQKTYYNKIKMIYIDPPYNTGKDFVYKDNFKDNISNYKEKTSQESQANPETNGRFHTDWLNMMYSRLTLARNLLTDDGVIFISIDDNEQENLKKICNEIFGEVNFVIDFIWEKHKAPKNDNKYVTSNHEYILMFSKNKQNFIINKDKRTDENLKTFSNPDNDPRGIWISGPLLAPTYSEKTVYDIESPNGKMTSPPIGKCWAFNADKYKELEEDNRIWFGTDGNNTPRIKRFLNELPDGVVPRSVLFHDIYGGNQIASNQLKELLNGKIFDYSKPISVIKYLIEKSSLNNSSDIILDFFSGSATTAHAVMKLNAEDGGNRKFIMVQLPELTTKDSEAYKAGYKNICEIGKERIRRAGKQITQEQGMLNTNLDIGFKVFKLDSTNIKEWDSEAVLTEKDLFDLEQSIKDKRTDEDVLYEVLLKYGVFDKPLKEIKINNKTMYDIGHGHLIVCLDNNIELEDVTAIANLKPTSVVFKESGFKNDNIKLNSTHTLQRLGVEDIKCI